MHCAIMRAGLELGLANEPRRIDVHHHIVPADYVEAVGRAGVTNAGGFPFPHWDLESTLAMLERCDIQTAVTSISCPGVYFGAADPARKLARRCNELAAKLVTRRPERFAGFACLPWPDLRGSLDELAYALDVLQLDGVVLLASAGGRYLGDPEMDELFRELDRRETVVFIHPNVPPGTEALGLPYPAAVTEFPYDTTRAITNLIYSGTLERCPRIRFIVSHAGGVLPYLAWRLALLDRLPPFGERAPRGGLHYMRTLYYDTAMSANRHALSSLLELVGTDHVLFGSDYPFMPEEVIEHSISNLVERAGFDAAERAAIDRENALKLFPRLAAL